jgi:hypothetical protein
MLKTTKIKGGKFKLPWKGPYKVHKAFNNTLGDDEVKIVNINKLKQYHSKSVVVDVMVANVYVNKYLSRYHQNKSSTFELKNSSRLVPKPIKFPWTNSLPKIMDDKYFWIDEDKSRSNEGKARNRHYKDKLKKEKLLYLTNYALRERGYKENLLQPHKLDLIRKNRKAINALLKTPLNELRPIWPLEILLSLEELIKLKKIKHHYYLWKKCFGRDDERVIEWNAQTKEISTLKNQNRIESFVEPFTTWFKPTTSEFNGKIIFEEYARGRVESSSIGSSKQKVVCA